MVGRQSQQPPVLAMVGPMAHDAILKLTLHYYTGFRKRMMVGQMQMRAMRRQQLASGHIAMPQVVATTTHLAPVFQEEFSIPWPSGSTLTVQVVEVGVLTSAVMAEASLVGILAGAVTLMGPGGRGGRPGRIGHAHDMPTHPASGTSAPTACGRAPTRTSSSRRRGAATSRSPWQLPQRTGTSQCPQLQPTRSSPRTL